MSTREHEERKDIELRLSKALRERLGPERKPAVLPGHGRRGLDVRSMRELATLQACAAIYGERAW